MGLRRHRDFRQLVNLVPGIEEKTHADPNSAKAPPQFSRNTLHCTNKNAAPRGAAFLRPSVLGYARVVA